MADKLEEFQNFGREQLEAASLVSASFAKRWQSIAAETTEYSKKALENHAALLEKLFAAKSFENAMQIQSEHAKAAYESAVAQATKIGELYTSLAKEALKPMESAMNKATGK
jgi:hypothetical protein